jgi:hypothetical protein
MVWRGVKKWGPAISFCFRCRERHAQIPTEHFSHCSFSWLWVGKGITTWVTNWKAVIVIRNKSNTADIEIAHQGQPKEKNLVTIIAI